MSLITLQDEALAQMAEPRTSDRRQIKHICAVLKKYRNKVLALGFTEEQINAQVRDIRDMHKLQEAAE